MPVRATRRSAIGAVRFVVAWLLLGATRALVLLAPFRLVRRLLGEHLLAEPGAAHPAERPSEQQVRRAQRVGGMIQRAAAHTPWRSDCYPQALAARIQLRAARIPHTVLFGLRRDEAGRLAAHAWVLVGGDCVVGGDPRGYTVVGCFDWRPVPPESRKLHGNLRLLRPHAAKRDRAA